MQTSKPVIETTYVYLKTKRPGEGFSFSLYGISPKELREKILSLVKVSENQSSAPRRRKTQHA